MANLGVKVYYSKIPTGEMKLDVYPKERADEINSVRNDRLKKEKYYAWKLLERAFTECGFVFSDLEFTKNENGKWVCDRCHFSLSHTDGMVAVALSDLTVGVDVEKVSDRAKKVAKKVFSADELSGSSDDEILYTTKLWTIKESIFKTLDERIFSPQNITISEHEVRTIEIDCGGEKYVVSVAGEGAENAEFYEK